MDKDNDEFHKVEKLLQSWATKICESTNDIISSALGRGNEFTSQGTGAIFDDMRDRQSRIITVCCILLNFCLVLTILLYSLLNPFELYSV